MNIPNRLTLIRIFLVPVFVFFVSTNLLNNSYTYGLIVFLTASFTDFLDGYIARKQNLITNFGKFMDPLADKMLVISAMVVFVEQGLVSAWVVIVIISRDFIINSIRLMASNKGNVIVADIWGKVKTVFQMLAIIVILIYKSFFNTGNGIVFQYVKVAGDVLIYMAVVLTVISACNYMVKNFDVWRF